MKRPIEKFGWKYDNTFCMDITQMRFERNNNKEYLIFNRDDGQVCIDSGISTLNVEELQAIYETAKQIKEENNPSNLSEKENDDNANIELQRKKVEEEIKRYSEEVKRYEEKNKEDYEKCKKAGYRELEKEEISKKNCWTCSHFRGGYIGAGCWCSQEKCDYKENDNVLISQ